MSTDGNGQNESFSQLFTQAAAQQQTPPEPATPQPSDPQPQQPIQQQPPAPEPTPQPQPPQPQPQLTQPIQPIEPEPTPQPQVPQPQVPPQQPPQPQLSEVATMAANAGFNITGKTDQQIVQEMAQGYQQMQPYAQWAQSVAPHYDQINDLVRQQQQQQQPQQPAQPEPQKEPEWDADEYFAKTWQAPTWDQQFDLAVQNNIVRRNPETGLFEATPGFEQMAMGIVPKMNEALTQSENQWRDLTRGNPYQKFHSVLQEPMQRAWTDDFERMFNERLAQRDAAQYVDDFERTNASWLYQQDPNTGQQVMSDQGSRFYEAITYFRDRGVTDPQNLIEVAMQFAGQGQQQEPQPPQPQPPAPPAAPTGQPAMQPPAPQVDPAAANVQQQSSFLQTAMQKAQHQPNAGGFTQQATTDPVVSSENELNSMFEVAAQQQQVQ